MEKLNQWTRIGKTTADASVPDLFYMQRLDRPNEDLRLSTPGGYWYVFMQTYKFSDFRRRMFEENYFPYNTIVNSGLNNSHDRLHYSQNLTLSCRFTTEDIDSFYIINTHTNRIRFFMTFQDSGLYIIEYL